MRMPIALTIITFSFVSALAMAQQRPNIIFIMADDMGYGEIEPTGQKHIKTPNLSNMATEGMLSSMKTYTVDGPDSVNSTCKSDTNLSSLNGMM